MVKLEIRNENCRPAVRNEKLFAVYANTTSAGMIWKNDTHISKIKIIFSYANLYQQ